MKETYFKPVFEFKGVNSRILKELSKKEFLKLYNIYASRANERIDDINKKWKWLRPELKDVKLEGEYLFEYNAYVSMHFQEICDEINREFHSVLVELYVDPIEAWVHGRIRFKKNSDIDLSFIPVEIEA